MKTINYKNFVCLTALSFLALNANANFDKKLVKQYKELSLKESQVTIQKEQKRFNAVKSLTEGYRNQFKKAFSGLRGKSLAQLEMEIKKINNSPLSREEKNRKINHLISKEQSRLALAGKKVRLKTRSYLSKLQSIYTNKKLKLHELGNVSLHSPKHPHTEARRHITFRSPFTNTVEETITNILGYTTLETVSDTGYIRNHSSVVEFGTAYGKAGMIETFKVPLGVRRIKLSTVINVSNYEVSSFSILGVAVGYSGVYLEAFDGYGTKCKTEEITGGSVSPITWVNANEGSKMQLLSCEFNVEENSQIAVSAGSYTFGQAFYLAIPMITHESFVDRINVEFIQ